MKYRVFENFRNLQYEPRGYLRLVAEGGWRVEFATSVIHDIKGWQFNRNIRVVVQRQLLQRHQLADGPRAQGDWSSPAARDGGIARPERRQLLVAAASFSASLAHDSRTLRGPAKSIVVRFPWHGLTLLSLRSSVVDSVVGYQYYHWFLATLAIALPLSRIKLRSVLLSRQVKSGVVAWLRGATKYHYPTKLHHFTTQIHPRKRHRAAMPYQEHSLLF